DRQQRNLRHDLQPAGEERVHDRLRIGLARLGARMYRLVGFGVIRDFASPRNAGIIVREMSTATATAPEAPTPMMVRKGMPARESPSRAIITVMPAKTTADPAV